MNRANRVPEMEHIKGIVREQIESAYALGYRDGMGAEICTQQPALGMVLVEGGKLILGAEDQKDNLPHEVDLSSFLIGKFLVTRGEWFEMYPDKDDGKEKLLRPITKVSWFDCIDYCNARSLKEGLHSCYIRHADGVSCDSTQNGYRLPTEAEWEYAAKGGQLGIKDNYMYSGSNDPDEVAWYAGNSKERIHRIGKKKPNQLGLYDMSGNIWEWCWDKYKEDEDFRVLRGGSYNNITFNLRSARRLNYFPGLHFINIGFRLVRGASGE